MSKQIRFLCAMLCALCAMISSASLTHAKMQFDTRDIQLGDKPKDITLSQSGSTAYILCQKSIIIYSIQEAKVTDNITLTKAYSQIALSPDETTLYLTAQDLPQVTVMQFINNIEIGKSPIIGNSKARVTVTAFLDYQCPFCAKVYPLLQDLLKKYPNDVKLVIKQYPLPMHKFAEKSSLAALAAAKQNKFEKVTELFFTNFSTLNDETILKYVKEAGVDNQTFAKDLAGADLKAILEQDQQAGKQVRVRGVPAVFINGIKEKGRSVEAYSQMVEEELKKKK
jgi:protein-disulfide isomerase